MEPCRDTIDAIGTAGILIRRVFTQHGLASKIISDRGPQYASRVMKAVTKSLGIRSALSTAFHPQTDGASERANQEVEQYLRAYCNRMQNNWAQLLPMAELAHNTHVHSATKKTPFELLHGYMPRWPNHLISDKMIPSAEERINDLNSAREEAKAAMKIAAESMKIQHDKYGSEGPDFQEGDQVWLEGKNLESQFPLVKLAPKCYGPFPIISQIGTGSYKLKLPGTWKIHPVFHASLLTPYQETEAHGPNFTKPPPDIIDDTPEYEVEEISKVQCWGRWKKWQYFIKWVGYPESENTWEYIENLKNSHDLIVDFHKTNPELPKPPDLTIALARLPQEDITWIRERLLHIHKTKQYKGIRTLTQ